ncbi:MAG: hypothetical protein AAFQ41_06050 [Cyanobacteria bacterium J06623_7]
MNYQKSYRTILTVSILWAIAILGVTPATAEPIRTLKDYLDQCVSPNDEAELNPECERLQEAGKAREESLNDESNEESEPGRELRRSRDRANQTEATSGISGYAGATLGAFFPDIDESQGFFTGNDTEVDDTAFGSSIYGGIKFSRYLATDIELSGFIGDVDSDLDEDESYSLGAFFLNPRFILPFGQRRNSLALFFSPGVGVSQLTSTVEDEVDDFDRTIFVEDDIRFTWQVKGGITVPVSRKFSILGQVRYASQTGDDALDYFGTELGVNFDF